MKYIEEYLEENLHIKALGKIETKEVKGSGVSLVIDGKETGIEIRWLDYAKWLEKKIAEI